MNLAGQVVDLVGVLTLGELPVEKRNIVVRLILENFNSFASSCLILGGFCYCVQLSSLVFLYCHGQGYSVLLDQHFECILMNWIVLQVSMILKCILYHRF